MPAASITNQMGQKQQLVRNVLSNYATQAIYGACNFVLVGYVVRKLGKESFGLIALIMSTIVITSLFERGISRALTKYVAEETERPGRPLLSKYVSTSFAWYLLAGVLGAFLMVLLANCSGQLFEIPADLQKEARAGWYLMGLSVALTFPFNSFQGLLDGHQRYDLVNAAHIVAIALRLGFTIAFFELFHASIMALFVIAVASFLLERVLWAVFAIRISGGLHLRPKNVSSKVFVTLAGFGTFVLINNVGNLIGYEAVKYVIGGEMHVVDVGGYTLIATIVVFAGMMVRSISRVLTPAASRLNALGQHDNQKLLSRLSTKYAMILSGAVCILPIFLLRPILHFWVGDKYRLEYLDMLAISGTVLLLGQWFSGMSVCMLQMVTGLGRVKELAIITLFSASGGLAFVWIYLHFCDKSLLAAVIGISVARVVGSLANFAFALKVLRLKAPILLQESVLRPFLAAAAPSLACYAISRYVDLFDLSCFLAVGALLVAAYAVCVWFFVLSRMERRDVLQALPRIVGKSNGNDTI